jgi:predicted permease
MRHRWFEIRSIKESVRDERAGELLRDTRFGWRQVRRNPGYSVTVILTLGLSIGVNTAIFSLVNALILKNLPYAHPERMGAIYTRVTGPTGYDERHHINGEQWELLRDRVPSLISAVSSTRSSGVNLRAGEQVQYVHAARVSEHYFDVLAIRPILGRTFAPGEDRVNGPKTAILSYGLWRNTFGSSPAVIGKSIFLKGEPYTVVAVLPDATTPMNADLYTAIQASRNGEGSGTNFQVITRLRDGSNWQEADAQLNRAWALRTQRYELSDNPGAQVIHYSVPLQKGETGTLRPRVLALMTAAGFILLIACGNLAGLTLVRMLRRAHELATRLALGASNWQIQRQLWIESLILALLGGVAGAGVGVLALRTLLLLLPENFLPVATVSLDARVLAFTALVSLATSLLFGMLPAFAVKTFHLHSCIASRTATMADRLRLRQGLIAGEVALTVVLLAASGVLIRTLVHLETLTPGFNAAGVITSRASLDDIRFHDAASFRKLLDTSLDRMRQIPGVSVAAVGLSLPYERALVTGGVSISDGPKAGQNVMTDETYVTPGYFAALHIPLLSGRAFSDADSADAQPVAIINQTFERKFFHRANPIGSYLMKDTRIVGVVGDVVIEPGLNADAPITGEEMMYVPAAQMSGHQLSILHIWFQPSWIVRTAGPIEGLTAAMQRAMESTDPTLPFSGFYSMRDLLVKALSMQRLEVALLGAMAALALLLSAIGLFALVASIVTQKSREIGIRIALGSTVRQAMLHVGAPGVRASAFGLLLGVILCAAVLPVMRGVLYGVGIYDPLSLSAVVVLLAIVAVIATVAPMLRLTRIDPAVSLREE